MKDPRIYVAHIIERFERVRAHNLTNRAQLEQNLDLQDVVIRSFEIAGEAAKRLDPAFKNMHPEIPWKSFAGFRDVLIHQYDQIELESVWRAVEIAHETLPKLRKIVPSIEDLKRELEGK